MYFHFVTISAAVSALLSVSISAATMLPNYTATFMDTARCFSCMSRLYEAVWPALSSIYKKPKNFTDLCNENNLDPQAVPFTYCPTICIRMWEEPAVAGVRIRGHIRGCLDELLYNGFNQTIVTWYRWMHRDSCRQYRKRELFKLPTELSDDSYISVCTCYDDYCNGRSSAAKNEWATFSCPLFFVLLCSLIGLFPIQRIPLPSIWHCQLSMHLCILCLIYMWSYFGQCVTRWALIATLS